MTDVDLPWRQRTVRQVERVLAEARAVIEPSLRSAIDGLPARTRLVAGYHAGLWDADGTPDEPTGKALRPALTLACARAASGSGRASPEVTDVAVAVEFMHDFSLLHDDVMDGDLTRRHKPAAWAVFGLAPAVLTGDALLALALDQASGAKRQVLVETLARLCRGQGAELSSSPDDVSLDECMRIAEDKTGALIGAACELGALAAGASTDRAESYRQFGEQLGVAFQLTDDLLGIWGDQARTGKPTRTDLATRKITLPVAAALAGGSSAAERLRAWYADGEASALNVDEIARLIEAAGGRTWAQEEADRRVASALSWLHRAGADAAAAEDLRLLADLIGHRDH